MERNEMFPIAITGFGIRFPGGVNDENSFWDLISEGKNAASDIPAERWDVERFYHPDPDMPGKMYVRKGGFLQDPIDQFDAMFFGVTPREADCMDPQQRLLLQVVWEAMHNAGIVPEKLARTNTGVYIGAFTLDNLIHQMGPQARDLVNSHTAVGSTMTILANRISYLLDLRGPSLSIDTACSSSLVAMHHACQAIWNRNCDLALVGGVNVMFRPEYFVAMCKGKFLAKDGRCKSFDERADGYGRGEGAGALVLKPLEQALQDGDIIHGVVKATGVNQDGRSNGITSPNSESQVDLIREVHQRVGVTPAQISFVEAHGTGTQAGDTAESKALGESLGMHRQGMPLPVGSVKANLGHLEAASGIAGVVKSLLCLKQECITPIAGLEKENPTIPFADLGIHLPRKLEALRRKGNKAYAAVNSFGYGGTNAHVLLEEAPVLNTPKAALMEDYLLPISAKDKTALQELVRRYRDELADCDDLSSFCYSAATRRGHYQHRLVMTGANREELIHRCDAFLSQSEDAGLRVGEYHLDGNELNTSKPIFVFTGMGPQWWAMGHGLFHGDSVFREEAQRCDAAFKAVSGWSIIEEMGKDEASSRMSSTVIAQPANFVLQAALAAMWISRGIEPAAIIGHSVGEVSAAYVAGVLSLEDAARVSFHRSQAQSKAAGQGGMLATGLSEAQAKQLLQHYANTKVDIAAVNGPTSVTLAGDENVLKAIGKRLDSEGVFQRSLQVEVPYHSPYMDPLMPEMAEALAGLQPRAPRIPLYSTVTGELVRGISYDAAYWWKNARQAVLFAPAMEKLLAEGHRTFLEIGPHPVLSSSIKQCAAAAKAKINPIASLRRGDNEARTVNLACAELHLAGCELNWAAIYPDNCHYRPLPAYPWQNNSHWLEGEASKRDRLGRVEHPLLGIEQGCADASWRQSINNHLQAWLDDHRVEDLRILPGAAYVELGLAAHPSRHHAQQFALEDLSFANALVIDEHEEPLLETRIDASGNQFSIASKTENGWKHHASGRFSLLPLAERTPLHLDQLIGQMSSKQDAENHYRSMNRRKLQYGSCFQGVEEVWQGMNCLLAKVRAPANVKGELADYLLHPAILDACFQSLLSVLDADDPRAFVPTNIRSIRYYKHIPQSIWCYGTIESITDEALTGALVLCDESGEVLVELRGIKARPLSNNEGLTSEELDTWLYTQQWKTEALSNEQSLDSEPGCFVIIGKDLQQDSFSQELQTSLGAAGHSLINISLEANYNQRSPREYHVDASSADDYAKVLQSLEQQADINLVYMAPQNFDDVTSSEPSLALLALLQGLARSENRAVKRLYCVSKLAQAPLNREFNLNASGLVALLRVAANEYPEYQFHSIDINNSVHPGSVVQELLSASPEHEVVWRGGNRQVLRMERISSAELSEARNRETSLAEHFDIVFEAGALSLKESQLADQSSKLEVIATSLNAQDLNQAKPVYPSDNRLHLGRVCDASGGFTATSALLLNKGLSSHFSVSSGEFIELNSSQSLPINHLPSILCYATAQRVLDEYSGLYRKEIKLVESNRFGGRLDGNDRAKNNSTVLIHAADTGFGRAAAQLALNAGAEVFATVLNTECEEELIAAGVSQCFSAHTLDFVDGVTSAIGNAGLDLILNPFAGEIAQQSTNLLRKGGVLLDFSGQAVLARPGISLHMLNLNEVLSADSKATRNAIEELAHQIGTGSFAALPCTQLDIETLNKKRAQPPSLAPTSVLILNRPEDNALISATPTEIHSNATYLVTGGFGGFGKGIVKHLVDRGARHIGILSRSGAKSEADQQFLEDLSTRGIQVIAPCVDVANAEQVMNLFATELQTMPPLKGIVHTAGVLDDSPINFVDRKKLTRVMGPKVLGAWNLHQASLDSSLDFFILFSSVSSMIGAAGQATYVIANTWMDNFAHYRKAQGLAATSVSWGALDEVGMAAIDPEVVAYFERVGLRPMKPAKVFDSFQHVLDWQTPHLGLVDMNWAAWASYYPSWAKSPRYAHLVPESSSDDSAGGDWINVWLEKSSEEQLQDVLGRLIAVVAKAMKLNPEKISPQDNLPKLGIDSLIAMELQTTIQQDLQVRLSTLELMKGNSLQQMAQQICDKFLQGSQAGETPVTSATKLDVKQGESPDLAESIDADQLDDLLAELAME